MELLHSMVVWMAVMVAAVLLLPIMILATPFFLAAKFTRLAARKLLVERPTVPWQELVQYEPVIGWRPRAGLDVYGQADDVFHLTTGADGWRGQVSVADADVVVFGDSFAFGHGAADEAMYTEFSDDLRLKPIGSDGYDMVHGLLWMQRLSPELAGKLVVWFVYYGNDLWDNLQSNTGRYRKPFLRQVNGDDGWEVVTEHVSPEPWPFPSSRTDNARLAEICSPSSPLGERVFGACDFLIRSADSMCHQAGARLAVVGIPTRLQLTRRGQRQLARLVPQGQGQGFDADRPDKVLQESCHRLGIPFIPLKAHLSRSHYLLQDIHWTPGGHRRVGAILSELHHEQRSEESTMGAA